MLPTSVLIRTVFLILRALVAYIIVDCVSCSLWLDGDTHAIINVRLFPPSEFCSSL